MSWINHIPELSEEKYRFAVVILLAVFVVAFIILGIRLAENGRYTQYDQQKNHAVMGDSYSSSAPSVFDSRTGKKKARE